MANTSDVGSTPLIVETLGVGLLDTNAYIVVCRETNEGMVVDPGGDAEDILAVVDRLGAKIKYIVNTHAHTDHILANAAVKAATGAAIVIHPLEAPKLLASEPGLQLWLAESYEPAPADVLVNDGDVLRVGSCSFAVLHAPGHSPGHIALAGKGVAFVGDVIFCQGVGRWDLDGGNYDQLMHSITTKILPLGDETVLYPGHGPATTVGDEKEENPWIPRSA